MLPEVNLLPKYERPSSVAFATFIIFTIVIIVSYLLLGFYYFNTKSNLKAVETKYSEVNNEVDILQAQLNNLAETDTSTIDQAVTFVENYNIPTSQFIVEINNLLPTNGYLKEYVYENEMARPTIHVETLDAVANYTTDLLSSPFIKDTKVNSAGTFTVKDEGLTDEEVDFDVIPRFQADFTLEVNKAKLKEASLGDE